MVGDNVWAKRLRARKAASPKTSTSVQKAATSVKKEKTAGPKKAATSAKKTGANAKKTSASVKKEAPGAKKTAGPKKAAPSAPGRMKMKVIKATFCPWGPGQLEHLQEVRGAFGSRDPKRVAWANKEYKELEKYVAKGGMNSSWLEWVRYLG